MWGALLPRRFGPPTYPPKSDDMTRTELGWVGAAKYDRDGRYDVFAVTREQFLANTFFLKAEMELYDGGGGKKLGFGQ